MIVTRSEYLAVFFVFCMSAGVLAQDQDGGPITSGQTLSGTLDVPSDRDIFRFEGNRGDRILIAVKWAPSSHDHPSIVLYPPAASDSEATADEFLGHVLAADGRYTIVIHSPSNRTGNYTLSLLNLQDALISEEDPDGGPILSGQTVAGTLDVESDMDAYRFEGCRGDRVLVHARWAPSHHFDPRIVLYPPRGGDYEARANESMDHALEEDGLYTIVILSTWDYTRDYSITLLNLQDSLISDDDPDGGPILSEQTVAATLNAESDMDAYRFEGSAGDLVLIDVRWTPTRAYDPRIALYPPGGGDQEAAGNESLTRVLEADGVYTIVIDSTWDYTRDYNLTFANIAVPPRRFMIYVDAAVSDPCEDGSIEHPYNRIQEAIDAAPDGARIFLRPGIYAGRGNRDLSFYGKAITIRSLDPNDTDTVQGTIISCRSESGVPHRAFSFLHGEDPSSVLEGVTIEGGSAGLGGAVFCRDSSPTIKGCIIRGCESREYGGAIYCEESAAGIVDCEIRQNGARKRGGGIYLGTNSDVVVSGCTFTGNNAGQSGGAVAAEFNFFGQSLIQDCTIERNNASRDGGGIYCEDFRDLSIVGCDIRGNKCRDLGGGLYVAQSQHSTYIEDCVVAGNSAEQGSGMFLRLEGEGSAVELGPGILIQRNDWLVEGDGFLSSDRGVDIALHQCIARVHCDVQGPCAIGVGPYSELHFDGDASVDLGGDPALDEKGHIVCEGLLRLAGEASLRNAQIQVTRASFEDNAIIDNCVVNAEAGAPYGQFFVEDSVSLSTCRIEADGDRYLDLDPRTFDWTDESMQDIWIDVLITEGSETEIGGLFELRGMNGLAQSSCGPDEFVCQVDGITLPEFAKESWTIDTLHLTEGAKLNLTNRFDFQTLDDDSDSHDEVLYVRDLVLEPNSVLNTGFHRVYYENLHQDPTARIVHVPLLGFSLNNITFDDEVDFATRTTTNNFQSDDPNVNRIHVERIVEGPFDPRGVMVMRNLYRVDPEDPPGAEDKLFQARAKALFAKSSEDQILIQFEYAFDVCSPGDLPDPTAELVVYLSDVPQLLDEDDASRSEHYLEIARIPVPAPGRPGSVGSGRLAVFETVASKGTLDFVRGTRVELELVGPAGTCVYINNWDPLVVQCGLICMDVTGDNFVSSEDLLTLVGEFGSSSRAVRALGGTTGHCLEGPFSRDGYVDTGDMAGWDWMLSLETRKNLCGGIPLTAAGVETSSAVHADRRASGLSSTAATGLDGLLVVGKMAPSGNLLEAGGRLVDGFYRLDSDFHYEGTFRSQPDRCTVRLVKDRQGHIYRVNCETGVWRLGTSGQDECVIPPSSAGCSREPVYGESATVHVGVRDQGVNPIGRPVLDVAFDTSSCYVVPVVVVPNAGGPYVAAARLELTSQRESPYEVVDVYAASTPWEDPNTLREIEVDEAGNVYVLCAYNGDDVLWRYPPGGDVERYGLVSSEVGCDVPDPVAMCISEKTGKLYVASARVDPEQNSAANVFEFSTGNPVACVRTISITGMQHVTGITEDPATGSLIVGGFAMDYDRLGRDLYPNPLEPPFYNPRLAMIPPGRDTIDARSPSGEHDLALPLSVLWAPDSDI
jgi:hypothetical protein